MRIRLDLYVEKILSRMVIDDAQRVEIEREIRNHLEEAISEGQRQGLTQEQAEEEAMRLFGQPSVVARYFKMDGGIWWAIFERLGLAMLIILFIRIFSGIDRELAAPWQYLVYFGIVVCTVIYPHFPRIEVNGGLRIRRLLRPSVAIPFDQIKNVVFQKGHLFGVRNIAIIYEGGKYLINPRMRGFRACALAIDALAENSLDDKLRQYLKKKSLRIRIEMMPYKITMTVLWIGAATLLSLHFGRFWIAEGLPWTVLAGGLLAVPLAIFQATRHADRAKAGLSYLLAAGFLFLIVIAFAQVVIIGNATATRHIAIGYALCFPAALLIIWWVGKRLPLLLIVFLIPVLYLTTPRFMPTIGTAPERILAISLSGWFQARWLPNGAFAWILRKDEPDGSKSAAIIYQESIEAPNEEITLPKKISPFDTYVFPARNQDKLAILLSIEGFEKNNPRSEIYCLDSKDQWQSVNAESGGLPFITINANTTGLWSPDEKHIATFINRKDEEGTLRPHIAVTEVASGKQADFGKIAWQSSIRWLAPNRFAFVQQQTTSHTLENGTKERQVAMLINEGNASTGEANVKNRILLKPNEQPCYLNGGQYALIMPLFREAIDLQTAKRISIPEGDVNNSGWDWNPEKQLLAYPAARNERHSALILVNLKNNLIRRREYPEDYRFSGIRISPDGTRVLYNCCRYDRIFASFSRSGILFREIWDIRDDQVYFVHSVGAIAGTLEQIAQLSSARGYSDLPQWSPDGKRIACMTYVPPYWMGGKKVTGGFGLSIFYVGE